MRRETFNSKQVSKSNKNPEISERFSRYLAAFFESDLHIWCLGSYLNMFSGKIKVFMKNIFSSHEVDFASKLWGFGRVFCLEISPKFDQKVRKFRRKNIFSWKILLSLKRYSDSSLNTKYEPLTPKTERISFDFHPKIMKNDHFQWFTMNKWKNRDFKVKK